MIINLYFKYNADKIIYKIKGDLILFRPPYLN